MRLRDEQTLRSAGAFPSPPPPWCWIVMRVGAPISSASPQRQTNPPTLSQTLGCAEPPELLEGEGPTGAAGHRAGASTTKNRRR
jgi:hypothetical protein